MRSDSAPPVSVSLPSVAPVQRLGDHAHAEPSRKSPPPSLEAEDRLEPQTPLIADEVRIELDAEAARYVRTVIDPETKEVVRTYPAESQLAFARAVSAYLAAKSRQGEQA